MSADPQLLALLRQCKEEPEGPSPRGVLGDWLEENAAGDALLALADLLRRPDPHFFHFPGRHVSLDADHRELADRHTAAWLGPLADGRDWELERGLFALECRAGELARDELPAPPLPGGWAWVGRLVVEDAPIDGDEAEELLAAPLLADFDGILMLARPGVYLPSLLRHGGPSRVTGLDLSDCHLDEDATAPLLARMPFPDLVYLDLQDNNLGPEGLAGLLGGPAGRRLRLLNLEDNRIGDAGLFQLANAPCAPHLRALELDSNGITNEGLRALARSQRLGELCWLSLTFNRGITLPALEEALHARFARRLEYACFAFLDLGDEMCHAISRCPHLRQLGRLDVSGDAVMTAAGVRELMESPNLPALHWLGVPTRLKGSDLPEPRPGLHIA